MTIGTALKGLAVGAIAAGQVRTGLTQAKLEAFNRQQALKEAGIVKDRAEQEIGIEKRRGEVEAEDIREQGRQIKGTQEAMFAKAGVDFEGSPLLILSETVKEAETAAVRTLTGSLEQQRRMAQKAEDDRRSLAAEAIQARFRGREFRTAGFLGAGSTLLTGAADIRKDILGMRKDGLSGLNTLQLKKVLAQAKTGKSLI